MSEVTPLPLPESAKRYWKHLVPVTAFPAFAVFLLMWKEEVWTVVVMFVVFFATSFYAMLPAIRKEATRSFWTLASWLYIAGAVFGVPLVFAFRAITGFPSK
jgi:hypothetical protein